MHGPNSSKVMVFLEHAGDCPYQRHCSDVKNPNCVAISLNGRLPSVHDPNTDLTLWASGAMIEYRRENI